MAHFLRGKQAGVQRDFSAGLDPQVFAIDQVIRYGINSQVSAIAYDPVQSLLAIGTSDSRWGSGQIYVFGQKRVSVVFNIPRKATVRTLQFCSDKLLAVDSKNDLSIFSLETTRIITSFCPPASISCLASDPLLDYVLIGLSNGETIAYDHDRQNVAPFRLPNFWREHDPRARLSPVEVLAFHPRHIGNLLVAYSGGFLIYSFQQNKPVKYFQYRPSGNAAAPRLTHAAWHPTGTFIVAGYEDSSLVFWDPKDGRQVLVRTVDSELPAGSAARDPLFKLAWCGKDNPDDTGILIAGGRPSADALKSLTFIELGPTPVYNTSSWQVLTDHLAKPRKQQILPTPPNAQVVDYCLIPRKSPHFAGASDPVAVIAILASGELITMSFPSGHPITPTNQLHVSLSFVHPFVDRIAMGYIDRTQWLGMTEKRNQGHLILRGGAEPRKTLMKYANRSIIQTAHADGTIRLYDVGYGDEIENEDVIQVDVARAVGRFEAIDISQMSVSGATGELGVGLRTGEVIIFRWGRNQNYGREIPHQEARGFGLEAIIDRAEPNVKEGLLPLTLFDQKTAPVTSLQASDIGFVAAGFEDGSIAVIDLRGPAVIYDQGLQTLGGHAGKRSSLLTGGRGQPSQGAEWVTSTEFAVMSLEGEDYSSILMFAGTSVGRVFTFKLLPERSGGYAVHFAGITALEDKVVLLSPVNIDTGEPALATQDIVANLRSGLRVNGVLVAVTGSGARIFKPATAKGAHKTWDDYICYRANICRFEARTLALVGLFGDGTAKAFSVPGLKEIASSDISKMIDIRRLSESIITPTGSIFGWAGPSELVSLNVWGSGQDLTRSLDMLFNPEALIPARPTISNLQWISGTTYVSPSEMDKLIGGPNRPPSKRMIEQTRAEEQAKNAASRQAASSASRQPVDENSESYWTYMQKQIQERTDSLGITGDNMNRVEENSAGLGNDINKFIRNQKKAAVKGYLSSKMGF